MSDVENHPLHQTFVRINRLQPRLRAQLGLVNDAEWLQPAAFFTEANLAAARERIEAVYQTSSPNVVANLILSGYSWSLVAVSAASYLHEKRVLDLRPENVRIHWDQGYQYGDRLAVVNGHFMALADDPAAGHPDATLLPNQEALRSAFLQQLEGHFACVLSWLGQHLQVNPRAVWPSLADRCASFVFWLLSEVAAAPRTPEAIAAELRALTQREGGALVNRRIDLITVEDASGAHHCFYRRATCCYAYRRPGRPYCTTCPHLKQEVQLDNVWAAVRAKSAALQE